MTIDGDIARFDVIVVGAGFSGLYALHHLRELGLRVRVLEKAHAVGGTWLVNRYPGARCDIESIEYSYSFSEEIQQEWAWTETMSAQPEIEAYLNFVADRLDLRRDIDFDTTVVSMSYSDEAAEWTVRTEDGATVAAPFVVAATGILSVPLEPAIPGMERVTGTSLHTSRWPESAVDLSGKRVGVIGNGASAIQFVPEIAPKVARLTIFQRTPNWCVPKPDRPFKEWEKGLYRSFPFLARIQRWWTWMMLERNYLAFVQGSFFGKLFEKAALKEMETHIKDPELRRKLTPDYPAGCKRILLTNDWYPALARPNVEVETSHIARVTADSIVTEDGVAHPVDVIIHATGFESTDFLAPMKIVGRGNADLNHVWARGAEAHRGVAVSGFPNFFMLYGPNTNLGHNSIIFMIECQANYIAQCVAALRNSRLRYIDVRKEAMESFNRDLQQDMQKTVWAAGCSSWYKTADGKVTNNWSSFTAKYWWEMRHPDFEEYALQGG